MTQPTPRQLAAWIIATVALIVLSLFTAWPIYFMLLPVAWLVWVLCRRRAGTGPTDQ